jgi:hypothetical protein
VRYWRNGGWCAACLSEYGIYYQLFSVHTFKTKSSASTEYCVYETLLRFLQPTSFPPSRAPQAPFVLPSVSKRLQVSGRLPNNCRS